MAKQTGRGSGTGSGSTSGSGSGRSSTSRRRQQKSPRTIDLEAKEIEDREAASAQDAVGETAGAGEAANAGSGETDTGAGAGAEAATRDMKAASAASTGSGDGSQSRDEAISDKEEFGHAGKDGDADGSENVMANDDDGSSPSREPGPQAPAEENVQAGAPERIVEVRKSGSLVGMLLSGLIGGGAVMAGNAAIESGALSQVPVIGGWLQAAGENETGGGAVGEAGVGDATGDIAQLQARLAEIAGRLEALETASRDTGVVDTSAIEKRLAELEAGGGSGQEIEALRTALAQVEARADEAMSTAAQAAAGISDGGTLAGDPQMLQSAIAPALTPVLAPIEERLAALEAGAGQTQQGNSEALSQLQSSSQELVGSLDMLGGRVEETAGQMETLSGSVGSLEERLTGLEARIDTEVLPSLGEIDAAAEAAVRGQAVARSVSARGLAAVLENGGEFTSELASAEALLGENHAVNALRPLARKGVASRERLLGEFDTAADAVISATSRPQEDEGILTRLMGSAQSLVRVRPAGPVEGDDPAAILSRMEAAISSGDYQTALDEHGQLPPEGQEAASGLAALIGERIEAERLIGQVITSLGQAVESGTGSSGTGQEG